MQQSKICPLCGQKYTEPPAISRADNATEICPQCGTLEALKAAGINPELQADIMVAIKGGNP